MVCMLETSDGGKSWEDGAVSDEEWHLNSLVDLGDGRLVIAGEAGYTYPSEDGGETWEVAGDALSRGPCLVSSPAVHAW